MPYIIKTKATRAPTGVHNLTGANIMTDKQAEKLAQYIINFIDYELTEYGREFNPDMVQDAINAYQGGAHHG